VEEENVREMLKSKISRKQKLASIGIVWQATSVKRGTGDVISNLQLIQRRRILTESL
jgi:hypothetical protein